MCYAVCAIMCKCKIGKLNEHPLNAQQTWIKKVTIALRSLLQTIRVKNINRETEQLWLLCYAVVLRCCATLCYVAVVFTAKQVKCHQIISIDLISEQLAYTK
jgi:hypothetical protein